ncbi:2S proteasome subunit beta 1 [Nematocida displodere]|uniref:Proteasome subunit beta n=1 Tax=Nematocida displodere TaxID=1805483 RepID=A0A177ECR6_9MICR|nr:2S proteasome subunit beta 1 [Nematocida displodere]
MYQEEARHSPEEKYRERGNLEKEASLGTTIMAVAFKDGVILGADTRTSMGTYISNRVSRKITKLIDRVFTCRSGSAADTQAVSDTVEVQMKEQIFCHHEIPSVKDVAILAKKIIYKNDWLQAGLIIAGVDHTGGRIFSIPLGGALVEQKCAIGGSGSIYVTGLCDRTFKENMTKEEAIAFVKTIVSHAMYRDNSSGGCIRMMVVTQDAEEEIFVPGDELVIG